MAFYRLSKLEARYNRDLTPYEIDKCKKDTLVFDGDTCVKNALDFCQNSKERNVKLIKKLLNKIYNSALIMDQDLIGG